MNLGHSFLTKAGQLIGKNKLSILIYHQVSKDVDPMRPADPVEALFRWHMQLLRDYFNPLPLATAVQLLQKDSLPANSVCVTFDDGYLNNLEVAQPVMEEFSIPATVFVATAFSQGRNMWNDRLIDLLGQPDITEINLDALQLESVSLGDWGHRRRVVDRIIPVIKYKSLTERNDIIDQLYCDNNALEADRKMMSQEEVRQLSRKNITIGAHTVDHPILKSLSSDEQRRQISGSKEALEGITGQTVAGFAYPNGQPGTDYDKASRELVREAGFDYAVTTRWGISTKNTHRFELNRFTPWDLTPARFHLRMLRNTLTN